MIPDGWSALKLADVANIKRGAGSQYISYVDKPEDGIRLIRISDFLGDNPKYIERTNAIERFILHEGDLLIAGTGATAGITFEVPKELVGLAFSYNAPRIRVKKGTDKSYVLYYLKSGAILKQQHALFTGNAQPFLDTNAIGGFKIALPLLPEQNKIAQILSTWDKAIETVEKLIANSQQKKKALMQQLLTGKKRFAGFDGEWKEVRLGELCKFMKGQGLSKEKLSDSGQYKCILYGELYTRYSEVISKVFNRTDHNEGVKSESGDVLIPASTTTSGIDLANATSLKESGILLSGDINILRTDKNLTNPDFLAYVLTHVKKYDLARRAQGITIIHLYGKDIKHIKIALPPLVEQDIIISAIASVEAEINCQEAQLNFLKDEKKALIQQLLTGKRRVKVN